MNPSNKLQEEVGLSPFSSTAIEIRKACDAVAEMLIKKNASYGDSALSPIRCFSRADSIEALKVRIDDKLSRLMRGNGEFNEDQEQDIMGYLVLLRIARARAVKQEHINVGAAPPGDKPPLVYGKVDPMAHHDI